MNLNIKDIKRKKETLTAIKAKLKKDFVGLDDIIDQIISSIEVWYTLPELLTRPLIINLWGMTGVGKTDLVRKLIKYLSFSEQYLEIQLNNSNSSEKIQDKLMGLNITTDMQSVLLLDEIQRFSTLDDHGETIRDTGYEDVWELLSDGSFSNAFEEQYKLHMLLYDLLWDKDAYENREDNSLDGEENEKKRERKFKTYLWNAKSFKRDTETNLSIEEIMKLDTDQKIDIIEDKLGQLKTNKCQKKYHNMLIFICGNLDEAYSMSKKVGEVDTDADILHERSKKISILDIKKALRRKFKPEQIARLGNNHIIYPSLSKASFNTLIEKKLEEMREKFVGLSSVDIEYDRDLYNVIYKNGVFPTQGVRPLFSTINLLVESVMPDFLLKALEDGSKKIKLSADLDGSYMVGSYDYARHTKKVTFVINELKKKIDMDRLAMVAAHEVGHAVLYMHHFKIAPIQICCDGVSNADGFVVPHSLSHNKDILYKKIEVLLAGKIAEETIFGVDYASGGSCSDLHSATSTACDIIRDYNMHENVGVITPKGSGTMQCQPLITDDGESNEIAEKILKDSKKKATKTLASYTHLMKKLIPALLEKKELSTEDVYKIAKDHITGLKMVGMDKTIDYSYYNSLKKFLDRN